MQYVRNSLGIDRVSQRRACRVLGQPRATQRRQAHVPEDEPTTLPVSWFDFEFEEQPLSVDELKALIYEEILLYHSSAKREEYARNKASAVSRKKPKKPKHARRK